MTNSKKSDMDYPYAPSPHLKVRGIVSQGHRIASGQAECSPFPTGTIELQKPFFLKGGLDLEGYFPGTLNISIAPKTVRRAFPEFQFKQIKWFDDAPAEDFSMSRCQLKFKGKTFEALIYQPHPETKPDYFHHASTLEVLAPFIPGMAYGAEVDLIVNPEEFAILDEPDLQKRG